MNSCTPRRTGVVTGTSPSVVPFPGRRRPARPILSRNWDNRPSLVRRLSPTELIMGKYRGGTRRSAPVRAAALSVTLPDQQGTTGRR